ncbi:MAG TPA: aspartate-semialdehyde dehydrogenase [Candidatus Sulfomarinibacteraceae bacterium]|nr:aspartate-semialdehyde dehydrogenase [Candidatus Sulfomarinibacteraceae bacterium]
MARVAVLGATGAVGLEMLKIMEERNFVADDLVLLSSVRNAGKKMAWRGMHYTVSEATPDSFSGVDIVLSAVSSQVSRMLTPEAVSRGAVVVDNSSAFRLDPQVPLVIPEVNPEDIALHRGIVANPNCSTIIALVAIKPLHDYATVRRMVVSTYQAVSGAGAAGVAELQAQVHGHVRGEDAHPEVFPYPIAFNVIPHIDTFYANGYTGEEMKMQNEARKIMHSPNLRISCTCVRVPVFRSHSEAITLETERSLSADKARELLAGAPGIRLLDDPVNLSYPMPLYSSDQDLILVGRIREDISADNSLVLWVSGDQVRKGAATNAVQIAEMLI